MRHVSLTCRNHPDLRWSCKRIAVRDDPTPGAPALYNSRRSIFFFGRSTGALFGDGSGPMCTPAIECDCSPDDLIIAPEDAEIAAAWGKK